MIEKKMYFRLIDSLKVLASDVAHQKEYLSRLGTSPSTDELALEFDDSYRFFESGLIKIDENLISKEFLSKIDKIDRALSDMSNSGDAGLWFIESLENPEWALLRNLAAEALALSQTCDSAISGIKR